MSTPQNITNPNSETVEYLPLVDYLAFTVKVQSADSLHGEARLWLDVLGGGTLRENGMRGYTHAYSCLGGAGAVCWRPDRVDMGVHVVLPGSALALLPDYGDEDGGLHGAGCEFGSMTMTPDALIRLVLEQGGKFTRVDVNQDTSQVTFDDIRAAISSPHLVSKARGMRHIIGFGRDSESAAWVESGSTVYVGSREGRRLVRFYDKAAEQGIEGKTWVRCEVEFKGDDAHKAAVHLAGGRSVGDLIVSVVDFRNEDSSQIEKRTRCDWWAAWVGVAARVSFARTKVEKTIEDAAAWVEHAVAPTLAMLACTGADLRHLLHVVTEKGFARLDASRRQRAYRYRDAGYSLLPAVPEDLADVFTDLQEWVINRAFMCREGV